jgi:hypothetical protein
MGIINVTPGQTGLVGVLPSLAYIDTNDTRAEVLATGYLNQEVSQGLSFTLPCLAFVTTKATPTSAPVITEFQVAHVGSNWSLLPLAGTAKFAKQYTTVGGAAAEAITVTGLLATDLAFVQVVDNGSGNVTVLQAVCTANTLTVTFSGNPGADTVINYLITTSIA